MTPTTQERDAAASDAETLSREVRELEARRDALRGEVARARGELQETKAQLDRRMAERVAQRKRRWRWVAIALILLAVGSTLVAMRA